MKATHTGHCQICGRKQLLPNGRLSNHGYNVHRPHGTYGFFIGTCRGAKELPFEQDITLVKESIEWAERMAKLQDESAEDVVKTTDKVWVHEYLPATWERRRSSYEWRELSLDQVRIEGSTVYWQGKDGKQDRSDNYNPFEHISEDVTYEQWKADHALQVRVTVKMQNAKRAEEYVRQAKSFRSYKADQERRIKGWKPQPLEPVK